MKILTLHKTVTFLFKWGLGKQVEVAGGVRPPATLTQHAINASAFAINPLCFYVLKPVIPAPAFRTLIHEIPPSLTLGNPG